MENQNCIGLGNKKEVITNTDTSYWQYYIGIGALFIIFLLLNILSYKYFTFVREDKEKAFIEGSEVSIRKFIVADLQLIFDEHSNLNQLSILKNYSQTSKSQKEGQVVGSILHVNRSSTAIVFDLQPLVSLVNYLLDKDFDYQIFLNKEILLANSEDLEDFYTKKTPINDENLLIINLIPKVSAAFKQIYLQEIEKQYFLTTVISVIIFFLISPLLGYLIYRNRVLVNSYNQLSVLKKNWQLNENYVRSCHNSIEEKLFPIILYPAKKSTMQINIYELIEEIKNCVYSYTIRFNYKFELELVADINEINIKSDFIIFKQIIISLLYNILYFMRGGEHTKKFFIKFGQDKVMMTYDSFAANERQMCNWSKDLFDHIGNPYILDCKKVFQLIKSCGFEYEVKSKQGKNEIIVSLNQNEDVGRVIKFVKNK